MRILKEYVAFVHYVAAFFAVILLAAMLPGDNFNVNTAGAVETIVLLAVADAVLTGPAYLAARRRGVRIPAPFRH